MHLLLFAWVKNQLRFFSPNFGVSVARSLCNTPNWHKNRWMETQPLMLRVIRVPCCSEKLYLKCHGTWAQETGDMQGATHLNFAAYSGISDCFSKLKIWQPLTVRCQGLQFGRVSQAAGNLQLHPVRFQAEQPLEQELTLRWRAMFWITASERLSSVSRCLLKKGHGDVSTGPTSLKSVHTNIPWKIIAFPLAGHTGKTVGSCAAEI